jgi:hypothetical protein
MKKELVTLLTFFGLIGGVIIADDFITGSEVGFDDGKTGEINLTEELTQVKIISINKNYNVTKAIINITGTNNND